MRRVATDKQRESLKKTHGKELRNELEKARDLLDQTKALLYRDVLGMTVLDLAICLCQDGMGIANDSLHAEALDVLLPPLLAQIEVCPGMAYLNGVDQALARAIGWLAAEGQASALTKVALPDLLGSMIISNSAAKFGFMDKDVQPRLADSSVSFRAIASPNPFVCDEADFALALPPAKSGANAAMTLQVVFLGGLFSRLTAMLP